MVATNHSAAEAGSNGTAHSGSIVSSFVDACPCHRVRSMWSRPHGTITGNSRVFPDLSYASVICVECVLLSPPIFHVVKYILV